MVPSCAGLSIVELLLAVLSDSQWIGGKRIVVKRRRLWMYVVIRFTCAIQLTYDSDFTYT